MSAMESKITGVSIVCSIVQALFPFDDVIMVLSNTLNSQGDHQK